MFIFAGYLAVSVIAPVNRWSLPWFLEQLDLSGADIVFFVLDPFIPLFMWITLALMYFYRYQEHEEAGLAVDAEE